jgi:hypothetical protein
MTSTWKWPPWWVLSTWKWLILLLHALQFHLKLVKVIKFSKPEQKFPKKSSCWGIPPGWPEGSSIPQPPWRKPSPLLSIFKNVQVNKSSDWQPPGLRAMCPAVYIWREVCFDRKCQIFGMILLSFFFLLRLGVPQAILLIMATPSCGF